MLGAQDRKDGDELWREDDGTENQTIASSDKASDVQAVLKRAASPAEGLGEEILEIFQGREKGQTAHSGKECLDLEECVGVF